MRVSRFIFIIILFLIRFVATIYLLISLQTMYLLMSGKLSLEKPTAFGKIAISFFLNFFLNPCQRGDHNARKLRIENDSTTLKISMLLYCYLQMSSPRAEFSNVFSCVNEQLIGFQRHIDAAPTLR